MGHIIVFDIGDPQSFKEAERQLDKLLGTVSEIPKFVVLAGNKTGTKPHFSPLLNTFLNFP